MICADLLLLGEGEGPNPLGTLVPLLLIVFIFYFIAFRPRRKEQKHREEMLGNLKKHDKIVTIGGIMGTVMEVREDQVIVKVDDNSNTRVKFSRGAIQKRLDAEGEDQPSK